MAGTTREVDLTGSATSQLLTWPQAAAGRKQPWGHNRPSLPSPLCMMLDSSASHAYGIGGSAGHHSAPTLTCSLTPAQGLRTESWEDSPPQTWPEADTTDSRSLAGLRLSLVFTRHKFSCYSQLDTRARCEGLSFIVLERAVPLIQQGFVGSAHDYTEGRKAPPHM